MATLGLATWFRIALLLGGDVFPFAAAAEPPEVGGLAEPRLTIESDSACPSGPAVLDALGDACPARRVADRHGSRPDAVQTH